MTDRCPEPYNGERCILQSGHTDAHRKDWATPPASAPLAGWVVPKRGTGRRPLSHILAILVIMVVGFALLGSLQRTGTRTDSPAVRAAPVAPVTLESLMTVAVTGCNQEDASGTVTNRSTSTVDIYITVHFIESSGVLSDDGIDSVSNVRPGETARWEASYLGRGSFKTCRAEVKSAFVQ